MSTPREGPNPLRPYYIPPSVGNSPDIHPNGSTTSTFRSKNASPPSTNTFGSSARNILADMDYSDFLSDASPSATEMLKNLTEQAIWKYTSVLFAQPFEVAKTVLQVHVARSGHESSSSDAVAEDMRRRPDSYRIDSYETLSDDSDADSISYFTPSAPLAQSHTRSSRSRRRRGSPEPKSLPPVHTPRYPPSNSHMSPHILDLKSSSSVLAVLSSLWMSEGSWGIWKATNSTYIHSILLSTITSFVRSFFSAFLALPDPGLSFLATSDSSSLGGIDVLSSPSPMSSLAVSVTAAGIAGIVLAPLDIARTKLMLTPSTHPPRSILANLRSLPSWTIPFSIAPITILHSTVSTLISASIPLFLRSNMGVDPLLTPNMYAIATFCGQAFELGVKLPIETILRRGQMDVARSASKDREIQTVVEVGPYRGVFGTVHSILYEDGERSAPAEWAKGTNGAPATKVGKLGQERRRRKGQGLEGLWRGWRVGMWGLVGVWGAATLGGVGTKGGEF